MSNDEVFQDHLNGFSGFLLATFVIANIFVVFPVCVPIHEKLKHPFLRILRGCRIIGDYDLKRLSGQKLRFPLSLETAPVIAVLILLITTTIHGSTIKLGIKGDANVKPYDVLVLFISLAYISIALDGTGALEAIAFWVSQRGGTSGLRLFVYLYAFFLGVACIVGNDPLILSGTPFLAYLTYHTGLDPDVWVFSEFMAANTASAVLVSSNPTNILITGSFHLNYLTDFTKWTVLPSVVPAILNLFVLLALFWRRIPRTLKPLQENPWSKLRDFPGAIFFSVLMLVTVSTLVGTSFVPGNGVQVWMVTMPAGVLACTYDIGSDWWEFRKKKRVVTESEKDPAADMRVISRTRSSTASLRRSNSTASGPNKESANTASSVDVLAATKDEVTTLFSLLRRFDARFPGASRTIQRLPIPLLPFAMCEFIMVRGLDQRGWITVFAHGFSHACTSPLKSVFFMGFVSAAFLCPVAGTNIGATIILVEIMSNDAFAKSAAVVKDPRILQGAIYAVALGSNLGAFSYTFAGSLAGLLWRQLLADKGVHISQLKFAMVNFLPLVIQTTVACAIIYGELYWFLPSA